MFTRNLLNYMNTGVIQNVPVIMLSFNYLTYI